MLVEPPTVRFASLLLACGRLMNRPSIGTFYAQLRFMGGPERTLRRARS
jgi:hypothetical protein